MRQPRTGLCWTGCCGHALGDETDADRQLKKNFNFWSKNKKKAPLAVESFKNGPRGGLPGGEKKADHVGSLGRRGQE